jgi:hypothetical protein
MCVCVYILLILTSNNANRVCQLEESSSLGGSTITNGSLGGYLQMINKDKCNFLYQ